MVKARIKMLFELPDGVSPIEFKASIDERVRQETKGVYWHITRSPYPEGFLFEEEME